MMKQMHIELLLVVWLICGYVYARDIYMDSPTACGQTFPAGEREVFIVRPRGSVSVPNPPTACRVYFESSYASSNYKFEIVVESAAFRDCGVSLSIFDGQTTGNNYIRMLGCGSSTSTGHFYSKDRAITLLLTRTSTQYYHGSNFQLKVELYCIEALSSESDIGTFAVPSTSTPKDVQVADIVYAPRMTKVTSVTADPKGSRCPMELESSFQVAFDDGELDAGEVVNENDPEYIPSDWDFSINVAPPEGSFVEMDLDADVHDIGFGEEDSDIPAKETTGKKDSDVPSKGTIRLCHLTPSDEEEPMVMVSASSLQRLTDLVPYSTCTKCKEKTEMKRHTEGCGWKLKWECKNAHLNYTWSSQPVLPNGVMLGNFKMAASIILSGNNYAKVALLFKFRQVGLPSQTAFNQIQSNFVGPVVNTYWQNMKASAQEEHRSAGLVIAGDGRMDSPGHTANFCTYTMMNQDGKKILAMEVVDKREVQLKSGRMEAKGFERAMADILGAGVNVVEVVTDAHTQISSIMKNQFSGVKHSWDMWHGAKNMGKKLCAAANEKGNQLLKPWVSDITNHFYYSAEHCNGDTLLLKHVIMSQLKKMKSDQENGFIHKGQKCLHGGKSLPTEDLQTGFIIMPHAMDTEAGDQIIGTYRVPAGAIVGIVLGIVVLVCAAILLGWCYKTGRLPGLSPYEYPNTTVKASTENLSKSDINASAPGSNNGAFVSWHNTDSKSVETKSNFDLSDTRIWESLTSVNTNTSMNNPRKEIRPVQPVRLPNRERELQNGYRPSNRERELQNHGNNNTRKPFERLDAKQLSNSPNTRMKGRRLDSEHQEIDEYHTINDLERETNAKDKLIKGAGNTRNGNSAKFVNLNPDKEGYMYDYDQVKKLSGDDKTVPNSKTQDFGTELRDAIKRASMKRQKSENDSDGQALSGTDTQNESSAFSSAAALNKQTDGETTGPDAQSSPKLKKKKRKNSKERKKSGKKKDGEKSVSGSPKKSKPSDSDDNNEDVPPELYAPIFSGDDEPTEPHNQYQPGYQGGYQPSDAQYDPRYPMGGYPPGMPPAGMYPQGMPGVPYQQAGQAQWYVESNPNGQQKMAFAMTTHSQSDDSLQGNRGYPLAPNYTSTPYYNTANQRGAPNDLSVVPAGTILDDPQIPAPGTSLMRYDEDPLSGVKTSQVVWTDAKKDPTDPPPDSSTQITRKTITRITTRATEDELPDAPNPNLQDMSWRTAQGIQMQGGHEPAFMSPTRSAYQANAIQYAPETPDRSNAGYYMGGSRPPVSNYTYMQGTAPPVIHEAPKANNAIRDRITLHSESET